MNIDRIALEDFRNYERLEVGLAAGINAVIGRNAQGKTNLLEAVHCVTGLGSPRAVDAALVRDGAGAARLHAAVRRADRDLRIDIELAVGRPSRALLNRTPLPSVRALAEHFGAVLFGPEDPWLVKGSPDLRRRFVDDLVVKLRPVHRAARRDWERILRQRNALLKTAPRTAATLPTLDAWDDSFCAAAARLTAARLDALARLGPYASKRYEAVAGGGALELGYSSSWLPEDVSSPALDAPGSVTEADIGPALARALASMRPREIERGISLVGPQRDDLVVSLASGDDPVRRDARTYASQGDQRTAALALKLGEHDVVADALGERPVLLLDDVLSELDPGRRRRLWDDLGSFGQVVVTAAEPAAVVGAGVERVLEVESGQVKVRD